MNLLRLFPVLAFALTASGAPLTFTNVSAGNRNTAYPGNVYCSYAGSSSFACRGSDATFGGSAGMVFYASDGTIFANAGGSGSSVGYASGTITDRTIYQISSNLQAVYASIHVSCSAYDQGIAFYAVYGTIGGNGAVVCAQGRGAPAAPPVTSDISIKVPLPVVGGEVDFTTFAQAIGQGDFDANSASIALQFLGLQDATGAPVAATVVPEPATWGMLALGFVVSALFKSLRGLAVVPILCLTTLQASAATISTIDISTQAQGDAGCAYTGPGPAASCSSVVPTRFGFPGSAVAGASASGETLSVHAFSIHNSGAFATATLSRSDFYRIDSGLNQVIETFQVTCSLGWDITPSFLNLQYSIGGIAAPSCQFDKYGGTMRGFSTTLSGLTTLGASGYFEVSSFITASAMAVDSTEAASATVAFLGFTDAQGNHVGATVVPEPAAWGLLLGGITGLVVWRKRGILAFLLVYSISALTVSSAAQTGTRSSSSQKGRTLRNRLVKGEKGRVRTVAAGTVFLTRSRSDYDEVLKAFRKNDDVLRYMLASGRVIPVENETSVLVVDTSSPTMTQVKVLDGPYFAQLGWAPREFVVR